MDFLAILADNFVLLYELAALLIVLGISAHISERMKRLTRAVIILIVAETVMFYTEQWTQTFDHVSILRPLMTASIYSIYPVILIVLMQLTSTKTMSRKRLLLILVPEIVSVPLFYTSQWTHLIFYYVEPNSYQGGGKFLASLPYFLLGFYALLFIIHTYIYFRQNMKRVLLSAMFIMLVPLTGMIVYLIAETGKDYTGLLTSAVVLYYLFVYIHMAKIDPLTHLFNRQSIYKDIQDENRAVTGAVSADMNDLKYLNDTFGHEKGDEALMAVASVMKERCGKNGIIYRVGGDEFVILYLNSSVQEIADSVKAMQEGMAKTDYVCAFGYAMREPGQSISDTIRDSDRFMYENKAVLKAAKKESEAGEQAAE